MAVTSLPTLTTAYQITVSHCITKHRIGRISLYITFKSRLYMCVVYVIYSGLFSILLLIVYLTVVV